MNKKMYKYYIMGVILILLFSPIASSTNISKTGKNQNKTTNEIISQNSFNPKINNILDMINESIVKGYLQDIVDFGPRVTGTYGCDQAAEYLFEKFDSMNLTTRYHNWASRGGKYNLKLFEGSNIEGKLQGNSKYSEKR